MPNGVNPAFCPAAGCRQTAPRWESYVHRQFWIPAGFAHGFIALEDNTQFLYKTTNFYHKDSERSIVWNDETIGIDWQTDGLELLINEKDRLASTLAQAELF